MFCSVIYFDVVFTVFTIYVMRYSTSQGSMLELCPLGVYMAIAF